MIKQVLQSQKRNFILLSINCSGYCSTYPRFPLQGPCIHPADVGDISCWPLSAASLIRIALSCKELLCSRPCPYRRDSLNPITYGCKDAKTQPLCLNLRQLWRVIPALRAPRMPVTTAVRVIFFLYPMLSSSLPNRYISQEPPPAHTLHLRAVHRDPNPRQRHSCKSLNMKTFVVSQSP